VHITLMWLLQGIISLLAYDQTSAKKSLVEAIFSDASAPLGHPMAQPSAVAAARHMLEAERRRVPLPKLFVLLGMFAWLLVSQTLATHKVACGGTAYWLLLLSVAPVVMGLMALVRPYLIEKVKLKKEVRLTVLRSTAWLELSSWCHTALTLPE
jgi:hypothetical protein